MFAQQLTINKSISRIETYPVRHLVVLLDPERLVDVEGVPVLQQESGPEVLAGPPPGLVAGAARAVGAGRLPTGRRAAPRRVRVSAVAAVVMVVVAVLVVRRRCRRRGHGHDDTGGHRRLVSRRPRVLSTPVAAIAAAPGVVLPLMLMYLLLLVAVRHGGSIPVFDTTGGTRALMPFLARLFSELFSNKT